MFDAIFDDGSLRNYITENIQDPWINTPFEGYVFMSPKQKGEFGEQFVSKYFGLKGSEVKRAKTSTAGHDRIIDKILSEIKFALACRGNKNKKKVIKDKFVINHISKDKDWERLVFFGINPNEEDCRLFWFAKEDFLNYLKFDDCVFKHQQGGKSIGNDDYICTKVDRLLECNFVRSINEW
jgi:hypothetical protein